MQSIVSIIVFLLLSILLGTITTRFISLAEEKNGKDFSIKEYIYSFKDFRLNLKYVIIFFILYLLVVKTPSVINLVIYTPVILALILGFVLDIKFMIIPDTSSILMCISGMMNLTVNFSKEALLSSILSMITGYILLHMCLFVKTAPQGGFSCRSAAAGCPGAFLPTPHPPALHPPAGASAGCGCRSPRYHRKRESAGIPARR